MPYWPPLASLLPARDREADVRGTKACRGDQEPQKTKMQAGARILGALLGQWRGGPHSLCSCLEVCSSPYPSVSVPQGQRSAPQALLTQLCLAPGAD